MCSYWVRTANQVALHITGSLKGNIDIYEFFAGLGAKPIGCQYRLAIQLMLSTFKTVNKTLIKCLKLGFSCTILITKIAGSTCDGSCWLQRSIGSRAS